LGLVSFTRVAFEVQPIEKGVQSDDVHLTGLEPSSLRF